MCTKGDSYVTEDKDFLNLDKVVTSFIEICSNYRRQPRQLQAKVYGDTGQVQAEMDNLR